jgi:uncharacterized repeat protein (TIGR01451 family)
LASLLIAQAAAAAGADLELTIAATPNPVNVGENLTYMMTVANLSGKTAKKVVLTDPLPPGTNFVSASPGCRYANRKAQQQNTLTCKLKRLRPSESMSWSIMVAPTANGALSNTVSVKSNKRDPNLDNNTDTADVTVGSTAPIDPNNPNNPNPPAGNRAPTAQSITQTTDLTVPYLELQLIGTDPDNDTLSYELTAPSQGSGYSSAYVNPQTGRFYLSIAPGFQGGIALPFRVSDSKLFSPEAQVQIQVQPDTEDKGTGGQEVNPQQYAGFDQSHLSSTLAGAPGQPPAEPPSVDLSPSFPVPGDQGQQGSCVAWATGYALKSYQEGAEEGWSLNTTSHLFSPAYIYHQVNGGQDNGSQIYDALDLIISQGAATLATMPYSDQDFQSQPSDEARAEAAKFKGVRRTTLSGLSDLKGALVQRKPVVLGIEVFDQFYGLRGPDSVYNSDSGSNTGQHGRHAVTAVGYDNNRYGGAVKVINSWGTNWGDNGFFWMPYSFVPRVVFQMWTLEDGANSDVAPTPDPVPPPVDGNLPDLQVQSWNANLDFSIGGSGELEWEVINGGQAAAPAGVTVSLMLSKDQVINVSDTYVVYEAIPFEIGVGDTIFRRFSEGNGIGFQIPPNIEPGDYYLALLLDDLNDVQESNETNNATLSNGVVTLNNSLPDLSIDTWYAYWDDTTGEGALTYEISNAGGQAAAAGWEVGLVLSDSDDLESPNTFKRWLVRDPVDFELPVSNIVFRDDSSAAGFNLYRDADGNAIEPGIYYMALWADDTGQIQESDELNNTSFYWDYVFVFSQFSAANGNAAAFGPGLEPGLSAAGNGTGQRHSAHNGKILPSKGVKLRKVRIAETLGGGRTLEFLDNGSGSNPGPALGQRERVYGKTLHSRDVAVFPKAHAQPMPGANP